MTKLWEEIQDKINVLDIDYKKVRIYQDGLPECGFEQEIVRELAKAGSSNHQLVLCLIDKGRYPDGNRRSAAFDPGISITATIKRCSGHPRNPEEAARLLEARDRFIVKRIDETLGPGNRAIIPGALHRLDTLSSTDVRVERLDVMIAEPGRSDKAAKGRWLRTASAHGQRHCVLLDQRQPSLAIRSRQKERRVPKHFFSTSRLRLAGRGRERQ